MDFLILHKDLILASMQICIYKLKNNTLDDYDRDMIISHLEMYSDLLKEISNKNGKND